MYIRIWKLFFILAIFIVPLLFALGVEMGWNTNQNVVTTYTDTLGGGNVAASTLDSMATFPWAPRMSVTVGPGYNDTSFFSRGRVLTGYGDSIALRFYLRGWTTARRTQLVCQVGLWPYATPFTVFSRPYGNIWKQIALNRADSCTIQLIADGKSVRLDGRITKMDSTAYHVVNGLTIPYAPYYDIVMADSAALTGKACYAKVTVAAYTAHTQ